MSYTPRLSLDNLYRERTRLEQTRDRIVYGNDFAYLTQIRELEEVGRDLFRVKQEIQIAEQQQSLV
jgi:hypothetical protein